MHLNQKNVNVVAVDSMKPCLLVQPVPKDVRTLRPRSYNEFSDDMESLKLSRKFQEFFGTYIRGHLSPCIGIFLFVCQCLRSDSCLC